MKRALALKAKDQSAWLGHLGGVVLNNILGFQRTADFACGYFAPKHALNCVGAIENFGHGDIILNKTSSLSGERTVLPSERSRSAGYMEI